MARVRVEKAINQKRADSSRIGAIQSPPSRAEWHDYVDSFFDTVAPYQANGFLHRGILKQQIRDNCASETLLLAICAITARFLPIDQSEALRATLWAQLATQRLYSSSEFKLKHAISALILCKHASYRGAFNQAFLLAALANRYALKLGLYDPSRWRNRGDMEIPWVEQEQRRRIMFACYSVDRMTATGLRELTFCPSESLRIQLPCEDYNYEYVKFSIESSTPRNRN
ncbi:hypothetical protein N7488_004795 [Penicillium malachiteum]|nr:hypothetical protein N7488_004795 [Penicillium malachiteum]